MAGLPYQMRFANGMKNFAYLSGFVRKPQKNGFYIQQNNNMQHALWINVNEGDTIPPEYSPVTSIVRVRGELDEDGRPQVSLHQIDIRRPTLNEMPTMLIWMAGSAGKGDDFAPFSPAGELAESFRNRLDNDEEGVSASAREQMYNLLSNVRGQSQTRLSNASNGCVVAGFIDTFSYVEPNEYQSRGYGLILLRQHANRDQNIPIRLTHPKIQAIMNRYFEGMPAIFVGRVRRKVLPDDDNNIRQADVYVDAYEAQQAIPNQDIIQVPSWWSEYDIDKVAKSRPDSDVETVDDADYTL